MFPIDGPIDGEDSMQYFTPVPKRKSGGFLLSSALVPFKDRVPEWLQGDAFKDFETRSGADSTCGTSAVHLVSDSAFSDSEFSGVEAVMSEAEKTQSCASGFFAQRSADECHPVKRCLPR
uniref:Uncharacterized protein n=1 Tax=Noctiluca scintillans TaxID=2966 RepID=A0A7S1B217_NOCSC|mmetsp:Transcript_873/g.2466  ORF Transcript_873/g.2466 Transcript_873/m.2466 type:complete len:120 (+) Transcript_873:268-627(+)